MSLTRHPCWWWPAAWWTPRSCTTMGRSNHYLSSQSGWLMSLTADPRLLRVRVHLLKQHIPILMLSPSLISHHWRMLSNPTEAIYHIQWGLSHPDDLQLSQCLAPMAAAEIPLAWHIHKILFATCPSPDLLGSQLLWTRCMTTGITCHWGHLSSINSMQFLTCRGYVQILWILVFHQGIC